MFLSEVWLCSDWNWILLGVVCVKMIEFFYDDIFVVLGGDLFCGFFSGYEGLFCDWVLWDFVSWFGNF